MIAIKKLSRFIALHQKAIIIVMLLLSIALPLLTSNRYILRMATLCLMYVMLALGLNLITGYMGQMSFGHAAFWGIGSYTAAILIVNTGMTTIPAMLLSMVVAGLFGYLVALPSLKLKGYYLTIVTLGFCEIIRLVELNWNDFTGGPMGILGIPSMSFFGIKFSSYESIYFVILALVIITTIVIKNLVNSNFGLAIKSIRDDEDVAETMGINIVKAKRTTFVISAVIAGCTGAFFAQYITFVHPSTYTSGASLEMVTMIIFGGLGSIPGTFLGAITLTLLPELLRDLMEYRMLIYGVLMVLMMIVKPNGILGDLDFRIIRAQISEEKKQLSAEGADSNTKKVG